jgi:hypothetical protein
VAKDYFGDESGHLRGLLNGGCEYCVIAVVEGDQIAASRCPKQTVRDIEDIAEAKWHDLLETQKRRVIECLADQDPLKFGYAVMERSKLHTMENYHLLHQNVCLPPDWDLALLGYAYGELLFEMGAQDESIATFRFDRVASKKQSDDVIEHVEHFVPSVGGDHASSHQVHGIQAADCIAGAIAEDEKRGTDWLSYFDDDDLVTATNTALIQLEKDLSEYETGP